MFKVEHKETRATSMVYLFHTFFSVWFYSGKCFLGKSVTTCSILPYSHQKPISLMRSVDSVSKNPLGYENNEKICWFSLQHLLPHFPGSMYLLKVNNRNTRTRCEICPKLTLNTPKRRHWRCSSVFIVCSNLTIKTPKRHHWRGSGVFIVNFEHISHLALMFLLLTMNM